MQLHYMAVSIEICYPKHRIFYSWKKMYLEMYAKKFGLRRTMRKFFVFSFNRKIQQKKVRKMCMRWTFISNFNSNVALCTWVRDITIDIKPNCFYEWRSLVPYKIGQKFMYSFLLLTHSNMPFRTYCNAKNHGFPKQR